MEAARYRMAVSTALDFATTAARAELVLLGWLAARDQHVGSFGDGRTDIAGRVTLDRRATRGHDGARARWRLCERVARGGGTWYSTLVMRPDPRGEGTRTWLRLDVEHRPGPDRAARARPRGAARGPHGNDRPRDVRRARALVPSPPAPPPPGTGAAGPAPVTARPDGPASGTAAAGDLAGLVGGLAGPAIVYVLSAGASDLVQEPGLPAVTGGAVLAPPPGPSRGRGAPDEPACLRAENLALHQILADAERAEAARADELRRMRASLERAAEREGALLDERERLRGELRETRRALRRERARAVPSARPAPPEARRSGPGPATRPSTFAGILERMGRFRHVVFTGNAKVTRDLDAHGVANWVETAWDALVALEEFAAAAASGAFTGDFRAWCSAPSPGGGRLAAGKVTMKESATVSGNHRWRRERTFAVPEEVAKGGAVFMPAHVRIGGGNTVAPRLHFHDATTVTGRVYVGHLGPHLTNTRT